MLRIAFAAALACAFSAHAQDNTRARQLASGCSICHGTDGRGDGKVLPPLAGMPREHIASQMRAFRDGQRPATVMHQIAKGYSEEQIDALAAFFAAQSK
ncbi:MAG TPA: c-type cytochrome [Burkholderiales bacterium]|nr:c-type cytochrome [Burkholderiales bacterium]